MIAWYWLYVAFVAGYCVAMWIACRQIEKTDQ